MIFKSGWVPSGKDHRDIVYSSRLRDLPPSVDLSPGLGDPWSPVWNQLSIGSCGANAAAADIVFAAMKQQGVSIKMPSRLFIYWIARSLMGTTTQDSGVENRLLFKALSQFGWCDGDIWPYDTSKYTVKPPQACFDQAAQRKALQYLRINQDLDSMRGALASGDTFVFGFKVYDGLMSKETAKTGVVPMPSGQTRGGHDVLFVGYDDSKRLFKFRNSWGNWGDGGYGYIPYDYAVSTGQAGDFWTAKYVGAPTPPAPGPDGKVTLTITGIDPASLSIPGYTITRVGP